MISPIAPALLATALIGSLALYAHDYDKSSLEKTAAGNLSTFHDSHAEDARTAYNDFVEIPGGQTVVEKVVFVPATNTGQSIKYNKDGTIDTKKNGEIKETGPCKVKHIEKGKESCGENTTVTETVFGPPIGRQEYYSQARDVETTPIPAFNNMGNWTSQMFVIEGTNKLAVLTWPDMSGTETYNDDTLAKILSEMKSTYEGDGGEYRMGNLQTSSTGSGYEIDGVTFNVTGIDAPIGKPAIISLYDAS